MILNTMSQRIGKIERKTSETDIQLTLNLDGTGLTEISTGIPFFDHMLNLFANHGLFDLKINATGDLDIDYHHSVEDIGICLGEAFKNALGNGKGIRRFASGLVAMDESLCEVAIDVSNRPYIAFENNLLKGKIGEFDTELVKEFFTAFAFHAKITLHINIRAGENMHHIAESCFKAVGIILDQATQLDIRKTGIPSTKGIL